jgi:ligand-binding sensor domain-containing protein/two-component sensor histidine kinase
MVDLRQRCLLLSALWAFSAGLIRGEQLPLKIYTTTDGLPSDSVNCILLDSHGLLWLGTADGISRFDGYRFANLSVSDGLPAPAVHTLIESKDGTYWAGTSRGLARWNAADTSAASGPIFAVVHLPGGGGADEVLTLREDRAGRLWVGTREGLFRLEQSGTGPKAQPVSIAKSHGRPASIYALLEGRDGILWVGTEVGLYRLTAEGGPDRIAAVDGSPRAVLSMIETRDGSFWAGAYSEGLFEIRPRSPGGPFDVRRAFSASNGLAGDHVTDLIETSDRKIWASCHGGIAEIAADRSSVRSYTTAEGLPSIGLSSLASDPDGNLWIADFDAGVVRLARNGFRSFDERDGLASTRVGSVFQATDGSPCVFTRGRRPEEIAGEDGFLECFDGKRFHTQHPALPRGTLYGWGWSQVTLQDHAGEWWIPTAGGVFRYPAIPFARLSSTPPRKAYTTRDGLPSNALFRLYEDSRGDIWMGLEETEESLARWDRRTNGILRFPLAGGRFHDMPMSFAEDRGGTVWIGFFRGGLACYRGGHLSVFNEADGLPAGAIRSLHLDREGRLWIASGRGGVARIDRPEEIPPRFVRFKPEQGLSSENTSSLGEDRFGRIYVGTARGLDRIDPKSGVVQHFSADDGLARGVIESMLCDRNGNLWLGSTTGLSRYEPLIDPPRAVPAVRITQVAVNGISQALPQIGSQLVRLPEAGPAATPLQIDFAGIDFAPGGRLRYQYRLGGIDRDWSPAADQRSVVYAHLPAGAYRFQVRAIANDGAIGPSPAEVVFRVLPPLWKRPSVLLLFGLGAVALAYGWHRNRLKSVLAVERVRMRVATDLHDDIGTDLSEIAILSELLGRKEQRAPAGTLAEIGDRARRLVDSMSDIVWSTDPRKDDIESLVQRIRHFAANTLESQGIAWSLEVEDGLEARSLDPDRRRQILLIVKEALTNVARHADCTRACLRIFRADGEIAVEIEDNGKGFDDLAGAPTPGQGLSSMRARAVSLGGTLEVSPLPAGGTRVAARLPLTGAAMKTRRAAW